MEHGGVGAHKHQAGSTILWTGIRVFAAYSALAVPADKRLRATRELHRIERQAVINAKEIVLDYGGLFHYFIDRNLWNLRK